MKTIACILLTLCHLTLSAQVAADERLEPVLQAEGEEPAWTVYNKSDGEGFVILSGSRPDGELLGYSDHGSIDPRNIPPAMQQWLDAMQQLVTDRRAGKAAPRQAPRRAAAIPPLLTTHWHQRWPYNRMAPEYETDKYCAAGCVAVAMAQVLKYWSANIETKPLPAYTTETLELRLEALPPTTFNYAIMRDEYAMFDWDESAQEVARLMRYCGQAAQMDYDVYSGAETTGDYLYRYFGYKQSYTDKSYLEHMSGWADLLYEELQAGRPMLYSGKKYTFPFSVSGHVFVVDGYDGNGYFHINWGWESDSNGYFDITSAEGYSWLQMAVIGLEPDPAATSITLPAPGQLQTGDQPSAADDRAPLFDLQGRRVSHPRAPGLYIRQGRKVMIK